MRKYLRLIITCLLTTFHLAVAYSAPAQNRDEPSLHDVSIETDTPPCEPCCGSDGVCDETCNSGTCPEPDSPSDSCLTDSCDDTCNETDCCCDTGCCCEPPSSGNTP